MNKKSLLFIVLSLCFGAFLCGAVASTILNAQNEPSLQTSTFVPPTFSFQKNLKLGDSNQDVRQLQIMLNNDVDTRISVSGIGSKGQETTYFGRLTANAVARFQAKYRKEVLDPYNIYSPTSFVGTATRGKLNKIISIATVAATSTVVKASTPVLTTGTSKSLSSISTFLVGNALPLKKEPLPRLYTARSQQIKKGEAFVLFGAGFEAKNTIHIGSSVFSDVMPQDDSSISFAIPATANIQNGTYEVWVENSKGTSKISGQPINLVVTDSPQPTPVISSVLPATISGTETVTVTGSGFAPTGNDIVSGFGTIKNLSSNGNQITFSPRALFTAETIAQNPPGRIIKVDFYIVNTHGVSNVFGSVNLKI